MTETKRWYQSKTMLSLILAGLISLGQAVGVSPADAASLPDWYNSLLQIIMLVIAAVGRYIATKRLV